MSLGNVELRVEPQVLFDKACILEKLLANLRTHMDSVDQIVRATETIWMGDASDVYRKTFYIQKSNIDNMVIRLDEHPRDLMDISGIYTVVEQINEEVGEALPSDVIV